MGEIVRMCACDLTQIQAPVFAFIRLSDRTSQCDKGVVVRKTVTNGVLRQTHIVNELFYRCLQRTYLPIHFVGVILEPFKAVYKSPIDLFQSKCLGRTAKNRQHDQVAVWLDRFLFI